MRVIGYLRCILLLFEAMSGLKVNLAKSALIPIGEVPDSIILYNFSFVGLTLSHLPILVFLLERLISAKVCGSQLLKIFKGGWLGGNRSFCLREAD